MTHGIHTVQHHDPWHTHCATYTKVAKLVVLQPACGFQQQVLILVNNNHGAIPRDSRPPICSHATIYPHPIGPQQLSARVYARGTGAGWRGSCDVSRDVRACQHQQ